MEVTVDAVIERGSVRVLEKDRLAAFKRHHGDGEAVYVTFSDERPHSGGALRYWHKLRDRYADELGYEREEAKVHLKYRFGVKLPADEVPKAIVDFSPEFVRLEGHTWWLKSLRDYTKDELKTLTDRTKAACFENDVDIQDLIDEHE
jgi:hypothetical protein